MFSHQSQEKFFPYTPGESLSSSYIHFDLNLSEEQKNALQTLKISKKAAYENFGDLDNLLSEIKSFIDTLDTANIEISMMVANIIVDLINKIVTTMEQESAWVVIRASVPNSEFDFPRWHTDGYYFTTPENELCKHADGYLVVSPKYEQYKVVMTLLGPNTLFYDLPAEDRDAFDEVQNDRHKAAEFLKDIKTETASVGHGTLFIAGSKERAAVHSEPPIHMHRLFVAVAPSSKSKIKEREEGQAAFKNSEEYKQLVAKSVASFRK